MRAQKNVAGLGVVKGDLLFAQIVAAELVRALAHIGGQGKVGVGFAVFLMRGAAFGRVLQAIVGNFLGALRPATVLDRITVLLLGNQCLGVDHLFLGQFVDKGRFANRHGIWGFALAVARLDVICPPRVHLFGRGFWHPCFEQIGGLAFADTKLVGYAADAHCLVME